MTLASLLVEDDKPINIEEVCNRVRSEMKSTIGSTKMEQNIGKTGNIRL